MEQFEEKADQLEIKCSSLESKLQKMELLCAKKDKDNEVLQEEMRKLKLELHDKNEIIEKMPKENSQELLQKQRELTNLKIQENFNLKNVID